jgi:hypothetical protein
MTLIYVAVAVIAVMLLMRMLQIHFEIPQEFVTEFYDSPGGVDLKSGDLLLMRNNHMPYGLRLLGDQFGHAAIIYRDSRTGILYILENCSNESPDDFFGNTKNGPRITPLWTRMKSYDGRIYVRRLNRPLDPQREKRFDQLVDGYLAQDYKVGELTYIANLIGIDIGGDATNCSSFIAQVFTDLDIARLNVPTVRMRPQCFLDGRYISASGKFAHSIIHELKYTGH